MAFRTFAELRDKAQTIESIAAYLNGIRLALGAQTGDVLKLVTVQGMKLAFIGVALGLIGSFAVTRLMKSMLFEVGTTDPLTFSLVTVLLAFVSLAACYIPARRATRVDPLTALRSE
jgi:ABC-type antimicrobial peptide transport system permease subunit